MLFFFSTCTGAANAIESEDSTQKIVCEKNRAEADHGSGVHRQTGEDLQSAAYAG
jgi:hypothetical protein